MDFRDLPILFLLTCSLATLDKQHHLPFEIQFALHYGFVFLKRSLFLVQPVFIRYS